MILPLLMDVLKDFKNSGVWRLASAASPNELSKVTEQRGLAFFLLDGRGIHDKDHFLATAARVMNFPDYFRPNWDAFEDCITDMSWHNAAGFFIFYEAFDDLEKAAPSEFKTLLEIFKSSAEFWRKQGKLFLVVFRGVGSGITRELPSIIT